MKAFDFRLEKALQWRETQLHLQKSRVAAATTVVTRIEATIEALATEGLASAELIAHGAPSAALIPYAGYLNRNRVRTRRLNEQLTLARKNLRLEMDRLVEANRRLRLIENLKVAAHAGWLRELDRETADFADEAFLARMRPRVAGYNQENPAGA